MKQPEVYISHAWGGESDVLMNKIVKKLKAEKIQVVYDHKDLQYRGSISAFMEELGKAKAVIIIVSNKYLRSEYCMFELLKIYENNQFLHRIFPVVLDEVKIAKSTDRIELVKYWENQHEELEQKIRELKSLSYIEGITDDLNLYGDIRKHIAKLTHILRDINTLNIRLHTEENFKSLVSQIKEALVKRETPELSPLEWREKVTKKMPFRALGAVGFLISIGLLLYMLGFQKSDNTIISEIDYWNAWQGKWKQEVQSAGDDPIRGTIELEKEGNVYKGLVINRYPDGSSSNNELFDLDINKDGTTLSGKWKSTELLNQEGTFEWHLSGKAFQGYYTVKGQDAHFTWSGVK